MFLSHFAGRAQFYNLPADYFFSLPTEKTLSEKDREVHSNVKPYIPFFSEKYRAAGDSEQVFRFIREGKLKDLLFYRHLIRVDSKAEEFKLRIDPILNFEGGGDLADSVKTRLFTNTRGIIASGSIGGRFYFETIFSENQSIFPNYISKMANATQVVPGQGRWKTYKTTGYDYAFSSGFVSMQPFKFLNLQVGHGKQKIGNGYRSLLLSDNSFNYPYARITQQWFKGKVQYTNIYAVLMNLVPASVVVNPNTERLYQKKAASFQYLSINVTKYLNVGFFQGLIWQAGDARNQQQISWQYFNPLIYSNLFTYGLDNKNNILIGGDLKCKLSNTFSFYGQFMLDNLQQSTIAESGCGVQGGFTYFDAFGVKNLFLQTEFNKVQRTSYQSPPGTGTDQSYFHYNQTLAYTPIDGEEVIFIANYKMKRFFASVRYHLQDRAADVPANSYSLSLINARIGYVINPSYNLNISLGMIYRKQNFYNFNASTNETNYIYLGLKTSIYNLYYDF